MSIEHQCFSKLKGFTLVEILVALGLMAMTVLFVAVAVTQNRRTLIHGRQLQAVMLYGQELVEEVEASPPSPSGLPITDIDGKTIIGSKECRVTRAITIQDSKGTCSLERVMVTITWEGCPKPVVLTRDILLK
ncbi:MAG: prepilin-type N-terminal cleavage/methylation domain-containing protein [Vulcanimicrobiota bacterium]